MNDEYFFKLAANQAKLATCKRAKCGSVIILNNVVIGEGFNSPSGSSMKCDLEFKNSSKPKSDTTCCMHAEWRAILDAVSKQQDLKGSTLYFTRVDENGDILKSGEPYCTVCSRFALDVGISNFALWHEEGIKIYKTEEYNELSYLFHLK